MRRHFWRVLAWWRGSVSPEYLHDLQMRQSREGWDAGPRWRFPRELQDQARRDRFQRMAALRRHQGEQSRRA